ncbi:MAG: SpoIID/LytB domain-containing protein [Bacteroidales bacterium]|nr:SpoIID/LytB domain-containing protein [Bacteroidales bacterium]
MRINSEPIINVGIMSGREIHATLSGRFTFEGETITGDIELSGSSDGTSAVTFRGKRYDALEFTPEDPAHCSFGLHDVTIGIGFHWERRESQKFRGSLSVIPDAENPGKIIAINRIGLEEYLKSVISSEMSATASPALLRAHAVVSRSWLMRQLLDRGKHTTAETATTTTTRLPDGREVEEIVKWYDREDHTQFDVCADDHCQRYQGITRQTRPEVSEAVEQTRGETLTYDDEVCDARFSKCCGGVTERFENCWEPAPKHYLTHISDTDTDGTPFCDTDDPDILGQVLNNYDRETIDFFRWETRYTTTELSALISRRSATDFGEITTLKPLEVTPSGRIIRLLIEGTKKSMIVGKELEIRRRLSESHLRSSAFEVIRSPEGDFILRGRGWGHGVGMCQIGAAVMGARGYSYREILHHYFPSATITTLYP